MKNNYTIILALLISSFGFAQLPNLEFCAVDLGGTNGAYVVDLTVENYAILNGVDASIHTVGFYETATDATTATNAISTPTTYTLQTNTQTIYTRRTNTSDSTFITDSFEVIIQVMTTPCEGFSPIQFCSSSNPILNDLSDYVYNPSSIWYDNAAAGNILDNNTPLVDGGQYYYNCGTGACVQRISANVQVINPTPAPTGDAIQYCIQNWYDINLNGVNIVYWDAEVGGNMIPQTMALVDGMHIWASQGAGTCADRMEIIIYLGAGPAPTGASEQYFCGNTATLNDFLINENSIQWLDTASSSGTVLNTDTAIVSGTTYYVRQSTCGENFLAVTGYITNNTLQGNVYFDSDNNGCDANDIPLENILIESTNGTDSFATSSANNGSYNLCVNEGTFTTAINSSFPSYFTVSPSSVTNTLTGTDNSITNDFCITANQTINDVSIVIYPLGDARPGFPVSYQINYRNIGTTQLNGSISFDFDDTKVTFDNASVTPDSQTSNSLNFNYSNLNPFETRSVIINFTISTPPTVNFNDILSYTASINPVSGDNSTSDNTFTLNQTVVNSLDPNDIQVLEGSTVAFDQIDKYLHYIIRFQNTGTADAINVKVSTLLDSNLDKSTFQLETSSHSNQVSINNEQLIFDFQNIHLPDSTSNEVASHGYIAFKIKPKSDSTVGTQIKEKAIIFFDYNAAVITNMVTTEITAPLNVNTLNNDFATVHPNPSNGVVTIKLLDNAISEKINISIYNIQGQLIKNTIKTIINHQSIINLSNYKSGIYFIKIESNNCIQTKKVIIK